MTIVISNRMPKKLDFKPKNSYQAILTVTLIISATFLSSKTTVISNSSFKK